MLRITGIVVACLFLIAPAQARRHHLAAPACVETGSSMKPTCMGNDFLAGVKSITVTMHRNARVKYGRGSDVVAHPTGCPRVAFCGCGAAVRLFGRPIRALWLAANWFRFPRATPAPGMAAVRRHHVMVLEANEGSGIWRVYDANSGHHATRIHARSIRGYTIVDPRA